MQKINYKELSVKEFDAAAEQFDEDNPSVYNMCRKDYPDILEELEKEEFQDLLDAGCGTGAVISLLKKAYPDRQYTGIDLSRKMIGVAERKKLEHVTFLQGDCENLPFPENSFDAVTCSMSFHHYPHPEKFFLSCSRVLRKGGRLLIRDMAVPEVISGFVNHIEIPFMNSFFHKGDVHVYNKNELEELCRGTDLQLESFERRAGMRLHAVFRKK